MSSSSIRSDPRLNAVASLKQMTEFHKEHLLFCDPRLNAVASLKPRDGRELPTKVGVVIHG